jgi:hypothetical protein
MGYRSLAFPINGSTKRILSVAQYLFRDAKLRPVALRVTLLR